MSINTDRLNKNNTSEMYVVLIYQDTLPQGNIKTMKILLKLMHIKRILLACLKQTTLIFYYKIEKYLSLKNMTLSQEIFRVCVLKMTSQNIVSKLNIFQRFVWNNTYIGWFLVIMICLDILLKHCSGKTIIKDLAVSEYLMQ